MNPRKRHPKVTLKDGMPVPSGDSVIRTISEGSDRQLQVGFLTPPKKCLTGGVGFHSTVHPPTISTLFPNIAAGATTTSHVKDFPGPPQPQSTAQSGRSNQASSADTAKVNNMIVSQMPVRTA